ncbi:HAD family hydrolase [Evansella clarkii]|uniref:HAD family hydrolase n=1 Tax=Evansella clarkii TaxID=79879 RepID=UPI000B438EF3|nr:HAD family hydrolase [Evansella clarkii]
MAIVTVDFDGTLFQGNSFNVMFQAGRKQFKLRDWGIVSAGLAKSAVLGAVKGKEALRHEFFKSFARTFKGKTNEELDIFFQELVDHGKKEVHHDLINTIRMHQENGDTVIVLSGALLPFLKAFTNEVKLDVHVISTELLFDEKGRCTGQIGEIVNGDVKVRKVQEWLDQLSKESLPSNGKESEIWAYADSASDIPLLQYVQYPVVVNPKDEMKKIAEENEWKIFAS